jgi:AraC family transcriptional activator of pobA
MAQTFPRDVEPYGGIEIDRLPVPHAGIQLALTENGSFGANASGQREPHRHDYHELSWTRAGSGLHLIDGQPCTVRPNAITLIRRGQVHVFERASGVDGMSVRFRDELLIDCPVMGADPGWLLDPRGSCTIDVPPNDVPRLEGVLTALAEEVQRPSDSWSTDVERNLLGTLVLWMARWRHPRAADRPGFQHSDQQLHARFVALLDRDFAHHHDIGHYTSALAVPPATLSAALARVTGRTTKEMIIDRVLLEAARLLRFTELTVGEISHRTGFDDQYYFSRAFKRRYGLAPLNYRARARGTADARRRLPQSVAA